MTNPHKTRYDAVLFVSFGGPEGMADVIPFLENVLRGRDVPRERLLEVAKHYEMFGGVSPINAQNRQIVEKLRIELNASGPSLPVYFGNRNWHPLLTDAVLQMHADGVKRALAFVTSGYSSYSSCRQYLENIRDAQEATGPGAPQIDKIRPFYNHPEFIRANAEHISAALDGLPDGETHIAFTAHSIPSAMAVNCDYESQLREACDLVAAELGANNYALAFQSRSGPPSVPWLGPDILDHLKNVKTRNVVIAPIGFVSDHMEVIYDLDVNARQLCEQLGINMRRAATAGTHEGFIRMICDLILERINGSVSPLALGNSGARAVPCATECCPAR